MPSSCWSRCGTAASTATTRCSRPSPSCAASWVTTASSRTLSNHPQARLPAASKGGVSGRLPRCSDPHAGVGARQPVHEAAGIRSGACGRVLRPQPCDCAGAGCVARAVAQPARDGAGERCQRLRPCRRCAAACTWRC